jgi:hypothetical protein
MKRCCIEGKAEATAALMKISDGKDPKEVALQ